MDVRSNIIHLGISFAIILICCYFNCSVGIPTVLLFQKIEFICACCGCCCGMLSMQKSLPKPVDFWATNYYAAVNTESCTGCGKCVERCQVNAVRIDEKAEISIINLARCIGCGNCIASCPSGALSLNKKEKETIPPQDMERLYKTIADNKPGTLGKIKLITRMVLKK
jgi:Na+-translocating ferredoxin:NAD+ oxidoreductase subunit B